MLEAQHRAVSLGLSFLPCGFKPFNTALSENLRVGGGTWLDQGAGSLSVDPVNLKFRDRLKSPEMVTVPIRDHSVLLQIQGIYGGKIKFLVHRNRHGGSIIY